MQGPIDLAPDGNDRRSHVRGVRVARHTPGQGCGPLTTVSAFHGYGAMAVGVEETDANP
jgi:hypothetical protein